MNQLQADRMMTWAHFIETRLKPEELDMSVFVTEHQNDCATVACAAGWLPTVFPDDWGWEKIARSAGWYLSVLKIKSSKSSNTDMMEFFGLSSSEVCNIILHYNYKQMPTPKQVANRIKETVDKYEWTSA